jgi:hypothetical protein
MYLCANCTQISKPGEKLNKVSLQTRRAVYKDSTGRIISEGNEIAKEVGICSDCYEERNVKKVETFLHKQVDKVLKRGL